MTNNLRKAKKDLCAFAKKCKDFKYTYTDSALITFLITGAVNISNNLFSAETNKNIKNQKQTISTSMKDIYNQVHENDKLLKKTNLELIQLMEQGDHVVKSPWSSWQYGINGFSNNWGQTYKGRGDKSEKYTSPLSPSYKLLGKSKDFKTALSKFKSGYGLSSTEKRQERIASLNIDATIKPKEIHKTAITAPNINIDSPILAPLSVPTVVPATLTIPKPKPPKVEVALPEISAKPFVDFSYQNGVLGWYNVSSATDSRTYTDASGIYVPTTSQPISQFNDGLNHKFWTGYRPDTGKLGKESGIDGNALPNGYVAQVLSNTSPAYISNFVKPMNPRTGALFYFHSGGASGQGNPDNRKFQAKNIEMYIAGDIKAGNIGDAGMIGKIVGRPTSDHHGALGIHTVWNGKLSNITANLYGRAAFLSLETWWAGKMEFDDTSGNEIKVNIQKVPDVSGTEDVSGTGEENTIFLIYPGTYDRIKRENPNLGATKQRGGFIGKVDADIKTDKNIVYSVLVLKALLKLTVKGNII